MAEPPYGMIWNQMKAGKVVPFLGAGASLVGREPGAQWDMKGSAFLPSGKELSQALADETSFPHAGPGEQNDLAKVASYYVAVSGGDRDILKGRLHDLLDRDYQTGALHKFLAAVPVPQLIFCTNYDTLVEQAFREAKKPFDLVVYPSDSTEYANSVLLWRHGESKPEPSASNQLNIDLSSTSVIFKMHGTVDRGGTFGGDHYVVTEEDYIKFIARMTSGDTAIPAVLSEHLLDRNFLFLGYGLADWNLRVLLNNLGNLFAKERPGKALSAWAIQRSPSELENILWNTRKVSIFDMAIDDFVEKLRVRAG